jgi:hypothetical protein
MAPDLHLLAEFSHHGDCDPRAVGIASPTTADETIVYVFLSREAAEHAAQRMEHDLGVNSEHYLGAIPLVRYLRQLEYQSILEAGPYETTPESDAMVAELDNDFSVPGLA